jgi:hypothetical protein
MTSARKAAANRTNARSSTGPRTAAGKARAGQNARRHGLTLPVLADNSLSAEAEHLAREIAGPEAGDRLLDCARRVAEAQVDLARVRQARHALLAQALDHPDYRSERTMRDLAYGVRQINRLDQRTGNPKWATLSAKAFMADPPKLGMPEKFALVLSDLTRKMTAIDRYERRARSRRRFAIRDFDAARRN